MILGTLVLFRTLRRKTLGKPKLPSNVMPLNRAPVDFERSIGDDNAMSPTRSHPDTDIRRRGAVAVVLREARFLVIRRSDVVLAPGAFCFPGGGIEGEESEEQALVREIQEELGVAIRPVRRVWQSVTRWRVALAWWLGELDGDVTLSPNPAEVAEIYWLTAKEMLAHPMLLESNREFLAALDGGEIVL